MASCRVYSRLFLRNYGSEIFSLYLESLPATHTEIAAMKLLHGLVANFSWSQLQL